MKKIFIAFLSVATFFSICYADENLKGEKVITNYSVGYQIGSDFKRQGLNINPEMVIKGIQDAFTGNKPLLSPQDMRNILSNLQKKIATIQEQKMKSEVENPNLHTESTAQSKSSQTTH